MKLPILYFSKNGHTKEMAEVIANGMKSVQGIEVGIFDLEHIDDEFLAESKAVVFGTPTYYANTWWQIQKWFEESRNHTQKDKIGSVFATADYA